MGVAGTFRRAKNLGLFAMPFSRDFEMLIQAVKRDRFPESVRRSVREASAAYWFSDKAGDAVAVVSADANRRWGYVLLARDCDGAYHSLREVDGFATRDIATRALHSQAIHLG